MIKKKMPNDQEGHTINRQCKDNAFDNYLQYQKVIARKYVRIGTTYYKIVCNWIDPLYLKKWNKSTILDDHGRRVLSLIDHFDDTPDHLKDMEVR